MAAQTAAQHVALASTEQAALLLASSDTRTSHSQIAAAASRIATEPPPPHGDSAVRAVFAWLRAATADARAAVDPIHVAAVATGTPHRAADHVALTLDTAAVVLAGVAIRTADGNEQHPWGPRLALALADLVPRICTLYEHLLHVCAPESLPDSLLLTALNDVAFSRVLAVPSRAERNSEPPARRVLRRGFVVAARTVLRLPPLSGVDSHNAILHYVAGSSSVVHSTLRRLEKGSVVLFASSNTISSSSSTEEATLANTCQRVFLDIQLVTCSLIAILELILTTPQWCVRFTDDQLQETVAFIADCFALANKIIATKDTTPTQGKGKGKKGKFATEVTDTDNGVNKAPPSDYSISLSILKSCFSQSPYFRHLLDCPDDDDNMLDLNGHKDVLEFTLQTEQCSQTEADILVARYMHMKLLCIRIIEAIAVARYTRSLNALKETMSQLLEVGSSVDHLQTNVRALQDHFADFVGFCLMIVNSKDVDEDSHDDYQTGGSFLATHSFQLDIDIALNFSGLLSSTEDLLLRVSENYEDVYVELDQRYEFAFRSLDDTTTFSGQAEIRSRITAQRRNTPQYESLEEVLDYIDSLRLTRTRKPILQQGAQGAVSIPSDEAQENYVKRTSLISRVRDLFPELGEGFVDAYLKSCNDDPEKVIMTYLESEIPEQVRGLDRNLPRAPLMVKQPVVTSTIPSSNLVTPPVRGVSLPSRGAERPPEYVPVDSEESKIHKLLEGHRRTTDTVSPSTISALHSKILQSQQYDMYDDDYDDTNDGALGVDMYVELTDDLPSSLPTKDVVDKANKLPSAAEYEPELVRLYENNKNIFQRTSRKSKERSALRLTTKLADEQIEGWFNMMERDSRFRDRTLSKYEWRGNRPTTADFFTESDGDNDDNDENAGVDTADNESDTDGSSSKRRYLAGPTIGSRNVTGQGSSLVRGGQSAQSGRGGRGGRNNLRGSGRGRGGGRGVAGDNGKTGPEAKESGLSTDDSRGGNNSGRGGRGRDGGGGGRRGSKSSRGNRDSHSQKSKAAKKHMA